MGSIPVEETTYCFDVHTAEEYAAGFPGENGLTHLASEPIDRYRSPYEATGNPREAMQAYLDWEYGLAGQLASDGTHHFRVFLNRGHMAVDRMDR